ncbi:uncharacterized protein EDB91DRAFT_1078131 [Suillus paluster]|uniref:uncharacterized protein n=1 Tax=Suillus paluster TaxID=48578 RepID=UPI001B87D5BD|nr:uncharacterized protein EDB91DRAFT_1078131 [Suillus paluster]KAG1751320.1 hypothetical protein EDB91DRAFT_1078131 [Suillus paluster]
MTDGMGRRFSIAFGASTMITAAVIQTASNSVQMFIGARHSLRPLLPSLSLKLHGLPTVIKQLHCTIHCGELFGDSDFRNIGFTFVPAHQLRPRSAARTIYGIFTISPSWAWRISSVLQGFSSMIQVSSVWFVPKSPRWFVHKGKQDPLVDYEFEEIKATITFDREVAGNASWLSLIETPEIENVYAISSRSLSSPSGLALVWCSSYCELASLMYGVNADALELTDLNKVFNSNGLTNPTTQLLFVWSFSVPRIQSASSFTKKLVASQPAMQSLCSFLVYIFWLCFELVFCYFFIIETKNRTLEETAANSAFFNLISVPLKSSKYPLYSSALIYTRLRTLLLVPACRQMFLLVRPSRFPTA